MRGGCKQSWLEQEAETAEVLEHWDGNLKIGGSRPFPGDSSYGLETLFHNFYHHALFLLGYA